MFQRGLVPPVALGGDPNGGFDFTYRGFYTGAMPLDATPPGPTPVPVAARGGMVMGGRARLSVSRSLSARGGIAAGGRASLAVVRHLTARGGHVLGGRASLEIGSVTKHLAARGGLVMGGRAHLRVERRLAACGGFVTGGRASLSAGIPDVELSARGGFILGGRAHLQVTRNLAARGGIVVGVRASLAIPVQLAARGGLVLGGRAYLHVYTDWVTPFEPIEFEIGVGFLPDIPVVSPEVEFEIVHGLEIEQQVTQYPEVEFRIAVRFGERYIGPGSGIVTDLQDDLLDRVREGDRFPTFYSQAGVDGMTGISHVLSRTLDSGRDHQVLDVQPVIPDDPRNLGAARRGEQQVVRPPEQDSPTRQAHRERREQRQERRRQRRRER